MGADCATAVVSATSLASALALDSAGSDSGIELPDPIKTIEKFTDCAKAFMTKDPTTRLKKVVVCALKVVLLIGGTEGAIFQQLHRQHGTYLCQRVSHRHHGNRSRIKQSR